MSNPHLPVLWLSGPTGVGKSSVGWEVFAQLSRSGVKAAFVDADQISLCHPLPEGVTHRVRARNLAAMWPHFRQEGMRCLVLAGFVDTSEEVREYTTLLPEAAFTLCRLRVDSAELKERFLGRGWRPDLVAEAVAEADALDRSDYADVCVDTGGFAVPEAARLVRERAGGWPGALPAPTFPGDLRRHPPAAQLDAAPTPVLWLRGATAVGKSTVGYEIFSQVYRTGVRAAYVDVKQISALGPVSDVENRRLKARNLAAVWAGYRAVGAQCLVVSGEADSDDTVQDYADSLPGTALTVCRLDAGPATLAERVARRARGGGPSIPGDGLKGLGPDALKRVADRAVREAEALDRAGASDLRIDTDDRSVQEVAADVRARAGNWPNLSP
ncbi:adenylyl-sulfate kinase [Nonomuraea sp. LP-02]|uniref:adenylyl-sulfate kinase n=1 Tax=Nonomuraea sp. LP-02 TaxID=3097960 RepID=UPI002E382022|nr:adenylyl-sulfate kinase [Nonomuraea sp. LP-02]MED7931616.1 adenylyl-sulfate kinase [Nonomuraea sp. LP-02]